MSELLRRFKSSALSRAVAGSVIAVCVLYGLVLPGCGSGKQATVGAESEPVRVPQALLIEREISGELRGRRFAAPTGVTVNRLGEVYVTDTGNNRLLKFNSNLELKTVVGGYGSGNNLFNKPAFVSDDNRLNLLISDRANRRIVRYTSQLVFVEQIEFSNTAEPLQFGEPTGLAVTSYGELWVADIERNRLAIFNNSGKFDRFVGDFGDRSGQLASPEKIIHTRDGGFLVCDAGNSRLVRFDQYGSFVREFKRDVFDYPIAAAIDRNTIWVVDANREELFMLDHRGEVIFSAGPMLTGSRITLKGPTDIAVLNDDRLLICDSGNNRLLVCRVLYEE